MAVVALLEVDADLIGGAHFELVHGLLGLGDAPRLLEELLLLIIVLSFSVREAVAFRGSILSRAVCDMNGELRKGWQKIP